MADEWGSVYPKLTSQDRIAMAIAKVRGIALLTGDRGLRKAAKQEGVTVLGTIGILDQLFSGEYISAEEYRYCLAELQRNNGSAVRLPASELEKRLKKL